MKTRKIVPALFLFLLFPVAGIAQPGAVSPGPRYDLSAEPVLYTVGYAHLDTEWRWDYTETINKFLKATLDDNFRYFSKYKPYVFNFSGARRYSMIREYYPEKYLQMKKFISQGRWNVAGSSVDECDANIPSPESLIRQVLYGNNYFRSEFGKESVDFMLPDCFGFQAHLPSVLAHAGIKGFSTQKLEWGSAAGIPFNIGSWTGPDGNGLVAALNATDYGGDIEPRLDTVKYWVDRVLENGRKYGVYADYRYYGTGDIGGAPSEAAIKNGIASLDNPGSRIHVYLSSSDQLFRDLTEDQRTRLPVYSGDLLLTQHSAGSLTSQAYMKRWNRKNELLAQAAEPLMVAADWLGGLPYPKEQVNRAWWLVLGSQMHDILPGTCIPKAYEYAWNDEVLGLNQFAASLEDAAGVVIRAMDTRSEGKALVVYNPLAIEREGIVEAEIAYPEGSPENIRVLDPSGVAVPVQILEMTKTSLRILFPARVPSFGLSCFDVQSVKGDAEFRTGLAAGHNYLENEYYKVSLNPAGDVIGIFDKRLFREILSAPAKLEFRKEHPEYWPAWNMDWKDRKKPPVGFVDGPARITLSETGPVRVSLRIERSARNSSFIQWIRLTAGEQGKRVEFVNRVEWQSKGVSLKAAFPLTASNFYATYNLGLGTIERSSNDEKKYEVPSREWFDLTDKSGNYGVTILEDCKFGSDKPADKILRLTLLYTPKTNYYHDQATQDWGTHEFTYGLYSHKGDWRSGNSEWQGRSLNQPLIAFQVPAHDGFLGKSFSLLKVSTQQVDVRAVKKTEDGQGILIRLQELWGRGAEKVVISFAAKILSATEVDGQERTAGTLPVTDGKLVLGFNKYQLRSVVLTLEAPSTTLPEPVSIPVALEYDGDRISSDGNKKDGSFVPGGYGYPDELIPQDLTVGGVSFMIKKTADRQYNVMTCKGQKILLPKTGNYNRLYILAAASRDTNGSFRAGEIRKTFRVQGYTGVIGQFDKRIWDPYGRIKDLEPGYIKRDRVAWFTTHMHRDTLNEPYRYGYLFEYAMDVSPAAGYLQLPDNDAISIFAITVADNSYDRIVPLMPLYDDFSGRKKLSLAGEERYVTEKTVPTARLTVTRRKTLAELPYRISMTDYADIHMPGGTVTRYYYSGTEKLDTLQPENGMTVPMVTDGMFDLLPADSASEAWFEQGEGRIVMDLQRAIAIDSIHVFLQLDLKHGPQFFSLWGSGQDAMPPVTGDPVKGKWEYIVSATPLDIWGGGKAIYSIVPDRKIIKQYRWLMWVSEDSDHGPCYFREVDIFEK
jgi:alpha-mannosidase